MSESPTYKPFIVGVNDGWRFVHGHTGKRRGSAVILRHKDGREVSGEIIGWLKAVYGSGGEYRQCQRRNASLAWVKFITTNTLNPGLPPRFAVVRSMWAVRPLAA